MRVLHFIQRYPPAIGGSEQWCREVSQRLADAGDDVSVLTLDILEEEEFWREPPMDRCRRRLGRLDWDGRVLVRRYRRTLPIYSLHHLVFDRVLDRMLGIHFYGPHSIEMYLRLWAEVKAADVVHLHTVPYSHNFLGYLAARRFGKRVVITPYFHPGHPAYERRCHYWLLRRCDAVLVLSEHEGQHLAAHGVDRERIVVTGAGIHADDYVATDLARHRRELRERHGFTEATKLVLFVGRKAEYKGVAVLIDAVERLLPRRDVALLLVGPSSSWFDDLYGRRSAEQRRRIVDLGAVTHQDKVNLLHLADVLVLPSRFESFGIVFPEAWICGTPVIGSKIGPIPDVVGGGGLTFEPGDAADLAEKIEIVLDHSRRAEEMVRRGRELVHGRYNWRAIAGIVRRAYAPPPRAGTRILISSSLFPPSSIGGAELVAYRQAQALAAMGHEVQIFAGRLSERCAERHRIAETDGEFRQVSVGLTRRDFDGASWNLNEAGITAAFAKMLERFRPDVVHFHNLIGLSLAQIDACRRHGIPTVLTLHDYWGLCFKNTMTKNDGRLCLKSGIDCLGCRELLATEPPLPSPVRNGHVALSLHGVDRLVAPSRYLADRYADHGIERTKLTVISNGVDPALFGVRRSRHDVLTLGFVGQLSPHKGPEYLVRALRLVNGLEGLRLLIVGEGTEEARLRALCLELGLAPYVVFRGRVEHDRLPGVYAELDVLVVPSVWPENSPLSVTEAMASGIPVIASGLGGIVELVDDAVTGFLVPPRDPAALAARIEHFLSHPEAVEAMGARAVEKIRPHSVEDQARRLVQIYREVIERRPAAAPAAPEVVLYEGSDHWSAPVLDMLRRLAHLEETLARRLLVCRASLVGEETFRRALLLVIPSPGDRVFASAVHALRRQVPLLVHDSVDEVKELCRSADAGLSYAHPETLVDGLRLLLTDEPLRRAMGANGRRFVASRAG